MAACNFKIPFSGTAEEVFRKARTAVQSQNGNFSGDSSAGTFDVTVFGNTIAGSYTVAGNEMDIVIDSKPFLLSCGMIETYLKSQMGL
jgi:hypothetical protein